VQTSANRYDVRRTLAYLTTDMGNVNKYDLKKDPEFVSRLLISL